MSSLMKSLARVAAGVMLAKGIGSMMKNAQQGQSQTSTRSSGGGILGDLLANATRGGSAPQSRTATGGMGGGLGDLLGQVLGGRSPSTGGAGTGRPYGGPQSTGAQGGLGGLLDSLTRSNIPSAGQGRATTGSASGGLSGGLGDLLGGAAAAGGLGGILGGLLGGRAQANSQPQNDATFGEVFNDALARQDEPAVTPTPEQNAVAGLMLRAMIQAAKADGKIDDAEKERLMGQLGDLDDEDRAFIREQMAAPVDAAALAREVPKGLESQVYLMSLMAIDFDSQAEAAYLKSLAQGLGISAEQANDVHQQVGVQNLYA